MRAFAQLLDRLIYTRSRNGKIALIAEYLRATPDPDRGWALAALTDALHLPAVTSATLRAMAAERVDPMLLAMSRHSVGDTAETIALMWPERPTSVRPEPVEGLHLLKAEKNGASTSAARTERGAPSDITLTAVIEALASVPRAQAPALVSRLLDSVPEESRCALLKLATGGLRTGVSARLAKVAFAQAFGQDTDVVDELWHALDPPYQPLFDWAEGRGERPDLAQAAWFRPFMLAHPLEDDAAPDLAEFAAEWKWDGIRVQIVGTGSERRLFSRGGEDISAAFPDVLAAFNAVGVVDGELMVRGTTQGAAIDGGGAASFNALQQRLGRKQVSARMLADYPAFVRLYDILDWAGEDLRALPWSERRARLEATVPLLPPDRFDLSRLIDAPDFPALAALREGARDEAIEGVMLKRRDSPYASGRRVGLWYKWKRDPLTADCVMMYAQRGNGRRASFYSDYTFGCWSEDGTLLPVGKAYSGFSDEELKWLDRFVRQHTIQKFGPVCEVEKTLVLEVAFDSIHASKRHKSGLAMRFPRIKRIRTDKPAAEADRVQTLARMVT